MAARRQADWSEFFARLDSLALSSTDMVVDLLPGGHREGREYRCGSINGGAGDSFGFNLETGIWVDFASGERGGRGFVSLYARVHGLKNGEAALEIARERGIEPPSGVSYLNGRGRPSKPKSTDKGWRAIAPFADALKPEHYDGFQLPAYPDEWGKPVAGWLYLDDIGRPWNYRIRFEKETGSKDYRPLSWCEDERGNHSWRWRDLPAPRILWNIEKLTKWPKKAVVIVEGEKTADAAERLLPEFVIATWNGGAGNEHHSDWASLLQRQTTIYLWPDQDEAGRAAMLRIATMFPASADVRVVRPDPEWSEKTDLADLEEEGWTTERALAWLLEHSAPAETPVTSDAKRPECSMATQDHGVLQNNVWRALKELNAKQDGPFYFNTPNGLNGELRSVRPNALKDRTMTTLEIGSLRAQVTKDIYFYAINSTGPHAAKPDTDLLTSVLALPSDELPTLRRLVRTPVFARDRRLISAPGYDKLSGIYYAPAPWAHNLKIIEKPNENDVAQAMLLIEDILIDFQFATPGDRANAYALMMLPLLRELIDGPTPMHRVEAPAFGTGKTLLLAILLMPTVSGSHWLPETRDDEEWRKMLVGALREGWPAIVIDNVRHLNSSVLASLLTAPQTWGARLLGSPDMPQFEVRCIFACTVNNPTWGLEMHRRTVPIRIDAKVENPFERSGWKHPDIKKYVERRRGEFLAALITLAQYGLNRPQPFNRTKGGYEGWAATLGPVLLALGFDGFLAQQTANDTTVESDGLADLMQAMADVGEFTTDEAFLKACDIETLKLSGRSDQDRKGALTSFLLDHRDQIRSGFALRFVGVRTGKKRFRIDKIN